MNPFRRSGPDVPPAPPAPVPATDASIVSDQANRIAEQLGELSLRLKERLDPLCLPDSRVRAEDSGRNIPTSPYFARMENTLYSIEVSMREIQDVLDRLAV